MTTFLIVSILINSLGALANLVSLGAGWSEKPKVDAIAVVINLAYSAWAGLLLFQS